MLLRLWIAAIGALSLVNLGGCVSSQSMTQADSKPIPQAPTREPQEVRTPLPPPTATKVPSAPPSSPASTSSPSTGPYLTAQVGYSKARGANFKEDNPSSPDCFLYVTATTCGGTLDSLGSSPVFGVSVGYRISPMFRVDVGYQRRGGYNLSGWDPAGTYYDPTVSSDAMMVSGFLDFPYKIAGQVQPFAGLAVGRSKNKMDALRWTDPGCCTGVLNDGSTNNSTAWQATLGAAISLVKGWVLDVSYRYADMGEFKKPVGADQVGNFSGSGMTTSATGKLRSNELLLAVRYEFP